MLSTNERQAVANWLGTPVTLEKRREEIKNSCPAGVAWKNTPGRSGWSPGLVNTRFQSAQDAGLTAADVPRLCSPSGAFAFPDTTLLRSQLGRVSRAYFRRQSGRHRLLARCGHRLCALEHRRPGRSALRDDGRPKSPGKPTLFFGDSSGFYYALDGETGKQVWKLQPRAAPRHQRDCHAGVFAGNGRVYIGVSSLRRSPGCFSRLRVLHISRQRIWLSTRPPAR